MNTTNQSLSADQVREKIMNTKGSFVKVSWKSNPKPAGAYKQTLLEKQTVGVVRAGINYANLSSVKQGIEDGSRGAVDPLPWGEWKIDKDGNSLFPYIIEHKGEDYIRLYPSDGNNHRCISTYYVDGELVSKDEFAKYLTPSEARKLLEPSEEDRPACFTIKSNNILGIPEEVNEEEPAQVKVVDNSEKAKAFVKDKVFSKTVFEMDYNDLDRLINLYFFGSEYPEGYSYECVAENCWVNDSAQTFTIDGIGYCDMKDVEEFGKDPVNFDYPPSTYDLMNYLYLKGILPKGNYVIEVSW